jgi:hypothetical protein
VLRFAGSETDLFKSLQFELGAIDVGGGVGDVEFGDFGSGYAAGVGDVEADGDGGTGGDRSRNVKL